MRDTSFVATCLIFMLLVGTPARGLAASAEAETTVQPLAAFEPLVGGRWQLGSSFQALEWGVGRESVKARGYSAVDGELRLVSEGMWYWHPGERRIKGTFTAVEMPVAFFDYTTRFEGDTMVSDIRAYAADGSESAYVETWKLEDPDHFAWNLLRKTPEGLQEEMGGTYVRVESVDLASGQAEEELREAVAGIAEDVMAGDIEGLQAAHLEGEQFTKFGPRSFDRQDVVSTNESEAAFFSSISDVTYEAVDLKIDVFGKVGIATYYPYVSFVKDGEPQRVRGRQTLVFLSTDSGWKIVHEHGTVRDSPAEDR